jgi:alkylation response protein AidB-like acyl-CoA dehydrogenase
MHTDFHMALQYAKDRVAFGRPIGSFQALKHILADMSLSLEMSAGLVAAAATALGSGAADGPELAHAAKAFVAEHGIELAHNSFQVFGGIGYTWEHDQHLFLRRLAADAECFGSPAWHRTRLLETAEVA